MAKRGRKPVLDKIKKREIVALMTAGCSRKMAARYVGCAAQTIQNTADRDEKFAAELRRAYGNAELGLLQNIRNASKKAQYWRAAAWTLERRNPEEYAQRGPDVITVDQIARLLSQFADIIIEEVPVAKYRKQILARLETLNKGLLEMPKKGTRGEES